MLVSVAFAALTIVHVAGPQDRTRVELARSLSHGGLTVPPTLFDRAVYRGRSFSDKAPGMSALALPALETERALGVARPPRRWDAEGDLSLWGLRLGSGGIFFLLGVLLVGRAADGLAPRTGAAAAATFGLGTLAAPLAATLFGHVAAGVLGFAAFRVARQTRASNRLLLAGLIAGTAVLFEYQAALLVIAVAVYVALRSIRPLVWYVLGLVPPAVALAVYDQLVFGSPFHLSYRYVANRYAEQQRGGFFGIGRPTLGGLREVLVGDRGLLVFSPVCAVAAAGLWLLWRSGRRADAAVCAAVTAAFVLYDAGYFLPYGGNSPGPRFLVPALPFLLLGLGPALLRWPRATVALAAVSVVLTTFDTLTWAIRKEDDRWYPGHGTSDVAKTVWVWLGLDRIQGAALVAAAAAVAFALGARRTLRR